MLNFTVGPVMVEKAIRNIAGEQIPYFRTEDFSEVVQQCERHLLSLLSAPKDSRCVLLTASGTGAMEASVMHLIGTQDKSLIVNGGTFGERFFKLCQLHGLQADALRVPFGRTLTADMLAPYDGQDYTVMLVNMHETSSGVLYDMKLIADFCKRNEMFLIVDAISSFIADGLDMEKLGVGAVILSSQKALALAPGLSMVVLSPEGVARVMVLPDKSLYLSLKEALKDGSRGQTPYTPAVMTILQLDERLRRLSEPGVFASEQAAIADRARRFRMFIQALPLEAFAETPSNSVTAVRPLTIRADEIVKRMYIEHGIWICPNGGSYADSIFRVGHIGCITDVDMDRLERALCDVMGELS